MNNKKYIFLFIILFFSISKIKCEEYIVKEVFLSKWGSNLGEFGLSKVSTDDKNIDLYFGPSSILIDDDENIYIDDFKNRRINKFDKNGNFLSSIIIPNAYKYVNIRSLSLDSKDNLYVAGAYGIDKTKMVDFILKFSNGIPSGSVGESENLFIQVEKIVIDRFDNLYVEDVGKEKIIKFDKNGNLINEIDHKSTFSIIGLINDHIYITKEIKVLNKKEFNVKIRKVNVTDENKVNDYSIKIPLSKIFLGIDIVGIDDKENLYITIDDENVLKYNNIGRSITKFNIELINSEIRPFGKPIYVNKEGIVYIGVGKISKGFKLIKYEKKQ